MNTVAAPFTTINRKPRVGDLVSTVGSADDALRPVYVVTEAHRDYADRVDLYGVESATTGLPNTFEPHQVETISARDSKRILAETADVRAKAEAARRAMADADAARVAAAREARAAEAAVEPWKRDVARAARQLLAALDRMPSNVAHYATFQAQRPVTVLSRLDQPAKA